MKNDPLVSIVIPCHNSEAYLEASIQSALQQTYPHVEVIVIDDGSTDGSVDVLKGFGDKISWESGPNRGACAARNRGVQISSGDLIQFLDSDDLLQPEKLARMVPVVSQNENALVYCNGIRKRMFDESVIDEASRPLADLDPVVFMASGGLVTEAPLHHKKILTDVGGFLDGLPCAQERDLHMRIACHGYPFVHFPESLFVKRRRPGSISESQIRVKDQHLGIVQRALSILQERNALTEDRRRGLAGMLTIAARGYVQHGRLRKARQYCREAKKIDPGGGLAIAYPGKAGKLAPYLGVYLTEPLVMLDDWFRSIAPKSARRNSN